MIAELVAGPLDGRQLPVPEAVREGEAPYEILVESRDHDYRPLRYSLRAIRAQEPELVGLYDYQEGNP